MKILVTGGAGYIGSHTIIELVESGHSVIVVDNLINSSMESIKRIEQITGASFPFYQVDMLDKAAFSRVFKQHTIDAVIHFAGLKAVGESVEKPLRYYRNNIGSTLSLLELMETYKIYQLVFSSSATVYGTPQELPLNEESRTGYGITNPYGQTKFMIEQILKDVCSVSADFKIATLRYFNPVGAHQSGLIGEDPIGPPNNLLPYISQVAAGKHKALKVFGDNYNTPDGTGVRDYIHVVDLAKGHLSALEHLKKGLAVYNLGTGRGVSVLEIIKTFEQASCVKIPYVIAPRRVGDVATCYADCTKAEKELQWKAQKSLYDACVDAWKWQSKNPNGYRSSH